MKYTNKYGLPEAFVRAVLNDPYDKGDSDFSATTLASTLPRAYFLLKEYSDKAEVDVSSRVASIIGQGAHTIAERAARPGIDICEKRYFADFTVDGVTYKVSGQIDLYEQDSQTILDWKSTKAYAFSKKAGGGQKIEWISQTNICAELMRRNGLEPRAIKIIALLKDWNKRDAATGSHPESEVMSVDLPLWESSKTVAFIEDRIRAFVATAHALPTCTAKETWGGNRCGGWCDAASVCSQYQEALKTGLIEKKEA